MSWNNASVNKNGSTLLPYCLNKANCKHVSWNNASLNKNGSTLLPYCLNKANCKHVSWNNASVNKNGSTLLPYCLYKAITINYPNQPTHFPYNSYPSVLDIALSQRCTTSKPQSVPALSSDHNPIVFKVLLHPDFSAPRILYDYKHANWPSSDIP